MCILSEIVEIAKCKELYAAHFCSHRSFSNQSGRVMFISFYVGVRDLCRRRRRFRVDDRPNVGQAIPRAQLACTARARLAWDAIPQCLRIILNSDSTGATDVVDGTVSVVMVNLYCGVGVYSHRLAYRGAIHQCLRIILNSDSKHDS
jgi:hypothetical protein